MNLFFDTETSNLAQWRLPSDDPRQPHLLQLAFILAHDDGTEVESWQSLVKPYPGCVIGEEAFKAHGISHTKAMYEGIDGREAADRFFDAAGKADLLIGHNVSFDIRIMRIHSTRSHGTKWEPAIPNFCTMSKATSIINLPPTPKMIAAGFNKPKSPNLGECVRFFFDEELQGAHDALVDVQACKRVFHALEQRKAA